MLVSYLNQNRGFGHKLIVLEEFLEQTALANYEKGMEIGFENFPPLMAQC